MSRDDDFDRMMLAMERDGRRIQRLGWVLSAMIILQAAVGLYLWIRLETRMDSEAVTELRRENAEIRGALRQCARAQR